MDERCVNVVQLNCQRAYAVMCDLGEWLCERRVSVALLQEPCVRQGRVVGLPLSMDVIVCEGENLKAAVVICDPGLDVMCVRECTNEYGVCVWLKGDFGELYVVSVYCRFGESIEPYLAYMDKVCELVRDGCVLIGMDANAVSPLWYSKDGGGGRENELRGRLLEEWIVVNGMNVLNEPSEWYTFSGPNGQSDTDVTLVKGMNARCRYEWEVKSDWGVSDHNAVLIRMLYGVGQDVVVSGYRWAWKNVDWEEYARDLRAKADAETERVERERDPERLVGDVMSWIRTTNDRCMKRYERRRMGKVAWWTDELERMKKRVRGCRRAFQRARRSDRNRSNVSANEYKRVLAEYKRMIWRVKDENWRQFVNDVGNRDPWGSVYKVCMGKCGRDRLSGLKVGDRMTKTWKESVEVLLERFFPEARMVVVRAERSVRH